MDSLPVLISGTGRDGSPRDESRITGIITCLKSGVMKIASQRLGPYSVTTQDVYLSSSPIACTVTSIAIAWKGGAIEIGVELCSMQRRNHSRVVLAI